MTTRANISDGLSAPRPAGLWQRLSSSTLSVEAIRQVDARAIEQYHMSSLVLMENAALGCVQWLKERYPSGRRTVILCGRGNNGGDGLAIARHLRVAEWPAMVIQLGPIAQLSQDARANWDILNVRPSQHCRLVDDGDMYREAIQSQIDSAELIIDAMLGSGARGAPRAPLADWIIRANASQADRIAIDIPTGLDATTGQPAAIAIKATATLTFVARKPGFHCPAAQPYLGEVIVLPIGIPQELIEDLLPPQS